VQSRKVPSLVPGAAPGVAGQTTRKAIRKTVTQVTRRAICGTIQIAARSATWRAVWTGVRRIAEPGAGNAALQVALGIVRTMA